MAPKIKGNDSQLYIRLPSDLKKACEDAANLEKLSINEWVKNTLIEKINQPAQQSIDERFEQQNKKIEALTEELKSIHFLLTTYSMMENESKNKKK